MKLLILILLFTSITTYSQPPKTNIILILADDLGYGDIGCYGQQKIITPNIDNLAANGIRFTQFYSGTAVCAPARCSFMTGLHTGHTAIRGNRRIPPEGQYPLPDSSITIAMLLKKQGYETAAFGKWALGFINTSGDPQKKGFDEFYGYNCQTLAHDYYPDHLWQNHERIDLPGNLTSDSAYSADLIHGKAMEFLSRDHANPFFLYLPYTLPHADLVVPHDSIYLDYVKRFNETPLSAPEKVRKDRVPFDPYPHASFAAMVSRLDRYVGEIMQMLKEKNLEENTIIIFTSDNGPHKEGGGDPEFFNSNGGLKGIKRDLYEGGIREPMIVYQKGKIKPGVVDKPFVLYDLFPTFQEIAGQKPSRNIDGISMFNLFQGKKQMDHPYLYWELHEAGGKQAVRFGNWKAIRLNVSTNKDPVTLLYRLDRDPAEKTNVASQYRFVVKTMNELMRKSHVRNKDWPLLVGE